MNERTLPLFGGRALALGRTNVMGILNVNDDSFYEDSRTPSPDRALQKILEMADAGIDILDVGAESTRPGSHGIDAEAELRALIPLIRSARERFPDLPISADTRKARVARAAVEAGADIVNDVSGLLLPEERGEMLRALADTGAAYVLTHTRGTPETMSRMADYDDFWGDLTHFFERGIAELTASGISRARIVLDPGVGFAKRMRDNLEIVANLGELKRFGQPILIGASRKGFLGRLSGEKTEKIDKKARDPLPPSDRLAGTLAVTALCADAGVDIVRVHDVRENIRAIETVEAAKRYRHA